MKKKMENMLNDLLNIYGISGAEDMVRDYIEKEIIGKVDTIEIDAYGNLLATKVFGKSEGNPVIMLNSHMDTVSRVSEYKNIVNEFGIYRATEDGRPSILGADDRAGIAIILSMLDNVPSKFQGTLKLLFTCEEEIGCVGANNVDIEFYKDVDLSITFDRKGNSDIVVGTEGVPFCSNIVGNTLESIAQMNKFKYRCVSGGLSDAYEFSGRNINSVNLSVGYENEHTFNEFLVYKDMVVAYQFGIAILKDIAMYDYKLFGNVPKVNSWIQEPSNAYSSLRDYEDDYGNPPFVYQAGKSIIVSNNFDEVEIQESDIDELISQLEEMKIIIKNQ